MCWCVGWNPLKLWSQISPWFKCFLVPTWNTVELMRRPRRWFMHGWINLSSPPPNCPGTITSCGCPLTLLLFPLSLCSEHGKPPSSTRAQHTAEQLHCVDQELMAQNLIFNGRGKRPSGWKCNCVGRFWASQSYQMTSNVLKSFYWSKKVTALIKMD